MNNYPLKYQKELEDIRKRKLLLEQMEVIQHYNSSLQQGFLVLEDKKQKIVQEYIYLCEYEKQLQPYVEKLKQKYEMDLDQKANQMFAKYIGKESNPMVLKQIRTMLQRKQVVIKNEEKKEQLYQMYRKQCHLKMLKK